MNTSLTAHFFKFFLAIFLLTSGLTACDDPEGDFYTIDVQERPVVECYLEPGKPMRLILSKSAGFFAAFDTNKGIYDQINFINDAEVTISGSNFSEKMTQKVAFDGISGRIFNYVSDRIIEPTIGETYSLNITLADGKTIHGSSTMLPAIPIDSMSYSFSVDLVDLARVETYFTDPQNEKNYYHFVLKYVRNYDTIPRLNIPFFDEVFGNSSISLVSTYDLRRGQRAVATLAHVSEPYHDFLRSTTLATLGTQNPVVQPSKIKSTVWGDANPIGVFTCLSASRDTIRIL